MEKRIGIYICSGFGIGETVDCQKLAEEIKNEEGVEVVKVMQDLVSEKGVDQIKKDIAENELNSIVIGATSPRYDTDLFRFDNVVYDRVALREMVAWTKEPNTEETQRLAFDLLKMGIAKVRNMEIPEPAILDINDSILVVGGGFTGMSAALASAKAGYNVVLCEKADELGGFYRKLYKVTPTQDPYFSLEPNTSEEMVAEIMSHPNIKVMTSTSIYKTAGQPGMFDVTAKTKNGNVEFQVGAIIQATGWKQQDTKKLERFGYGKMKNVITNIQMEEMASNGGIKRPSDEGDIKNIAFIQCANQTKDERRPYCSSICCMTSLKQALYVREQYPNSNIYIIYRDMRTPGKYEMFYKRVQSEDNIFITKGEITGLEEGDNNNIQIELDNTLVGEKVMLDVDMVVCANGMAPATNVIDEEEILGGGDDEEAPAEEEVPDDGLWKSDPNSILNLTYRQGPDLPELKFGFPDSHYICFPYETRRTGIYAAGACRTPMDHLQSKSDANGSALKAIQIIESVRVGKAVHPRAGDKAFPDFFLQRCTQCKRCTEECPFGTLDEDVKGTPKPNPNRCRRCGICMGACPERIISFKDYSVRQTSEMIKSIYIPTEEEDGEATPRILGFLCENDAYPSLDLMAKKRIKYPSYFRLIPVRCLGSVNTSWIADSLSAGFDGVILIGCKYGDDYQCHFIRGSELANRRMENVQEKLKQLVLEPERVEIHTLAIDEYDRIPEILNTFAEVIEGVGANPYKEM